MGRTKSLSIRDLQHLVNNGLDTPIVASVSNSKTAAKKLSAQPTTDPMIERVGRQLQSQVGFKCQLKHNPNTNKVKVQFSCDKHELEELMTKLATLEPA